jgi:hypothetical protein
MLWALHPGDKLCHAVAPSDLNKSETLGYAETLCGVHLPSDGLESADRPGGWPCLPCAIGATADFVDPGQMGPAL